MYIKLRFIVCDAYVDVPSTKKKVQINALTYTHTCFERCTPGNSLQIIKDNPKDVNM